MKVIYIYKTHDLEGFIDRIKDKNVMIMTCESSVYPNDEKVYNIKFEQDVIIDLKYVLDDIYGHIKSNILKYELDETIFQCFNIDLKYVLGDNYEHIKSTILKYELDETIFQCFNVLTLDEMKRVIKLIEKAIDSITRDEYIDTMKRIYNIYDSKIERGFII